jgi:hypothetical protein
MAVFNRVNGGAQSTINVGDQITPNANAQLISMGIATPLNAYRVEVLGNLQAELGGPNAEGKEGAVSCLLRNIAANATVLAYQIDPTTAATAGALGAQMSVIVERSGWTSNAAIQTFIRAVNGANIGAYGTVTVTNALVHDKGLKLQRD